VSLSVLCQAQDQFPELQKKLDGLFTLTKTTADRTDIVTAGSVLVLHKEGMLMCSTQAAIGLKNTYKGGRLSPGRMSWGLEMGLAQPDLPTAQVPTRQFVPGEKFWVTGISAEKNGVNIKVFSDPFDDVRYYGSIEIPFNKKAMPSDDEILKTIAEVVTVDPGEAAAAANSGGAPAPPPAPGSAAAAAVSEDPLTAIRKGLSGIFVLATLKKDTGDIAKAGSIIQFKKDGFTMWTTEDGVSPIFQYKDGKFSMPASAWLTAHNKLYAKDEQLNPENVPKRKFVAGEKCWIVGYTVVENGVYLSFVSDLFQDVRYQGEIWFPFERKQPTPAPAQFMKLMDDVISVEPPPAEEAAAPAPAPAAPAAPAPAAIAPVPPPAAPPKVVALGQTRAEVEAILGSPTKEAKVGQKDIYYYPDMKVIFVAGKVSDIQ
jgi:hypothetical protein